MDESEVRDKLNHAASQTPEIACSSFLKIVHKLEGENPVIHSPVQYYIKVTELH